MRCRTAQRTMSAASASHSLPTCSPRRARASFTGFAGCAERPHNMGRARKLHRNHMINDLALAIP
jgi:hypothetical protein